MSRFDPHSWCDDQQAVAVHLDLIWDVDFTARTLAGQVAMRFREPAAGALDLDARGLDIREIKTTDGASVPWSIAETDAVLGDRLHLDLPDGTTGIVIRYATGDGAVALGWLEPQQTAGGVHPFMFTQCQPIHARSIVPCHDTPRNRVTYTARVTVPAPLKAVMSAAGTGEDPADGDRTTWLFEMPQSIPTYLLALAVGNLTGYDLGPRSRIYAEPETVEKAAWEFAEVESMIDSAERLFGPYVWDRFDMLIMPPAFPYGGMENPRLTFLTPTLLAGDRSQVNVVAHELAHSWTGNLVTNATMNDFWLNEGFTVYAERRILEEVYGVDYANLQGVIRRNALQVHLDNVGPGYKYTKLRTDLAGIDPDDVFSLVPYEKGAQFVLLLEDAVGREVFDTFLLDYIDTFRFQSITTEEFIDFLETRFPGVLDKIDGRRWIFEPDMPENELPVESARLDEIRRLASAWLDGARPDPAVAKDWSSDEWQLYLQNLPRVLPPDDCRWLDETFDLTAKGNYEVLVEWLTVAAASAYDPALPRVREVLTNVGRMKYLKPLYRALVGNPETAGLAREIFADVADSYHPLSRGSIAGMVEKTV